MVQPEEDLSISLGRMTCFFGGSSNGSGGWLSGQESAALQKTCEACKAAALKLGRACLSLPMEV
jgi:hypothetical protein